MKLKDKIQNLNLSFKIIIFDDFLSDDVCKASIYLWMKWGVYLPLVTWNESLLIECFGLLLCSCTFQDRFVVTNFIRHLRHSGVLFNNKYIFVFGLVSIHLRESSLKIATCFCSSLTKCTITKIIVFQHLNKKIECFSKIDNENEVIKKNCVGDSNSKRVLWTVVIFS